MCSRIFHDYFIGNVQVKKIKLEIWGRAQREAARGVRNQALINF